MVATIRNWTGDTIPPNGRIQEIIVKRETKTSIQKMPGADKNLIQKMGLSNRIFTIRGWVPNSDGWGALETAVNNTGSILYTSNALGQPINNVLVLFYDLEFRDIGTRPLERSFTINAVEII